MAPGACHAFCARMRGIPHCRKHPSGFVHTDNCGACGCRWILLLVLPVAGNGSFPERSLRLVEKGEKFAGLSSHSRPQKGEGGCQKVVQESPWHAKMDQITLWQTNLSGAGRYRFFTQLLQSYLFAYSSCCNWPRTIQPQHHQQCAMLGTNNAIAEVWASSALEVAIFVVTGEVASGCLPTDIYGRHFAHKGVVWLWNHWVYDAAGVPAQHWSWIAEAAAAIPKRYTNIALCDHDMYRTACKTHVCVFINVQYSAVCWKCSMLDEIENGFRAYRVVQAKWFDTFHGDASLPESVLEAHDVKASIAWRGMVWASQFL